MFCTKKSQIKIVIFNPGNHFERSVGYSARRLVMWCEITVKKKQVRNVTEENQKWVLTGKKKMFLMCTGRVADISFLYTPECTSVCHWLWELTHGLLNKFLSNGEMTRRIVSKLELKPCTATNSCLLICFSREILYVLIYCLIPDIYSFII